MIGVGTLPAARRRGIGARRHRAARRSDARERGAELVFLSAADDDVARLYERLGLPPHRHRLLRPPAEA